jgi:hypothetical protein
MTIEIIEPTDAERGEVPIKKRGGWPRGKPRQARAAPTHEDVKAAADRAAAPKWVLKARPNWESEDFVGVGMEGVDRLKVSAEKLQALHRDGYALQWVTRSVRGQEQPQELSKMTRGGWTPVHQSDFGGLLDGDFMPKGHDDVITVDDCMLVTRPTHLQAKARAAERRQAAMPLQITEEQLGHGIPGVTGSDHPTATRGNAIKRTMERVEIPE